MNIQLSSQARESGLFSNSYQKNQSRPQSAANSVAAKTAAQNTDSLAERIRNLGKRTEEKRDANGRIVFSEASIYKTNGFWNDARGIAKQKDPLEEAVSKYHYKDLSGTIMQAKTANSAGQAAIKAKRNVLEIKRKLAASTDDDESEELSIMLTHAKRMERVAKKKQRNLETEELIETTQKRDERMDKESTGGTENDMLEVAKDRISDAQYEVEDAMQELGTEGSEAAEEFTGAMESFDLPDLSEMAETMSSIVEEMPTDLAELTDALVSEEEKLTEAMDALEGLEAVNPHMSKEDLMQLKTKHRNAERKEIVKANMDYLKDMIDHIQKNAAKMLPSGGAAAVNPGAAFAAVSAPSAAAAMPAVTAEAMGGEVSGGFDLSI